MVGVGRKRTLRPMIRGKIRCGSRFHRGSRMRPLKEFCKARTPDSFSYSCKTCRTKENHLLCHDRYKRWKEKNPESALLSGIRCRAKKLNIQCTLTIDDIHIPNRCPVLDIPLHMSDKRTDNTPSVDRIDNTKGYTPNNIVVVSWRVNEIKKDASLKELQCIARFYDKIGEK